MFTGFSPHWARCVLTERFVACAQDIISEVSRNLIHTLRIKARTVLSPCIFFKISVFWRFIRAYRPQLLPAAGYEYASLWMIVGLLPSFLSSPEI